MRFLIMTRLTFSIFSVVAFVSAELNFTNWQPPKEGDLRAPCPAMNSLANHNFINHDGTNITVESLVPILGEVFHWSTEVATIVSEQGLAAAPDPSKGVFTLGDLNNHNIFEHDASLSRADYYFGEHDDHTFRQGIFDQFLSFFDGKENVTLKTAGAARYKRVQQSRADNPTFTYGETQQFFSYAETIFYFRAIVDPVTKACPVAWVKILFEQQRLPYLEGWRPPKTQFNGVNLARDVLELALVTPEKNQTITDNPRGGSIIG